MRGTPVIPVQQHTRKRCFVFINPHGFPSFESLRSSDISLHLLILRAEQQEQMKKRKPIWCLPRINPVEQGPPSPMPSHGLSPDHRPLSSFPCSSWNRTQNLPLTSPQEDFSDPRCSQNKRDLSFPTVQLYVSSPPLRTCYLFAICRKAGYSVFSL